jgi:predicted sulfurtransferase
MLAERQTSLVSSISVETQDGMTTGSSTHHDLSMMESLPIVPELCRHDDYIIALYYLYRPIRNVSDHVTWHKTWYKDVSSDSGGLGGRIRVSPEGLNGVLSGRKDKVEQYIQAVRHRLSMEEQHADNLDDNVDLDVKFCALRPDLPVSVQLFSEPLSVVATAHVITLVADLPSDESHRNMTKRTRHRRRLGQLKKECQAVNARKEDTPTPNNWLVQQAHDIYQRAIAQSSIPAAVSPSCMPPAPHLTPAEWNDRLRQFVAESLPNDNHTVSNVLLLDCRNTYETRIGYFAVPHVTTVLPQTRQYSELPLRLVQEAPRWAQAQHIFMYCTGGVRCERASQFLQQLLHDTHNKSDDAETTPKTQVYQLQGGIQRYLEQPDHSLYFKGKNFVFDPRRTDPTVPQDAQVVGQCLVCRAPHDDYDNGAAPCAEQAARCSVCRVLLLVCPTCRPSVACWGEESDAPRLTCGGLHQPCQAGSSSIEYIQSLNEWTFLKK